MTEPLLRLRERFVLASDAFETAFKKFHKEQQRHASRRGKTDGAKGQPPRSTTNLSAYGKSIYQSYVAHISDLGLELEPIITEVERDHIAAITHLLASHKQDGSTAEELALSHKTNSELSAADDRYHDKIEALDNDPSLHAIQSRYDDVDDRYQSRAEELGRHDTDRIITKFPAVAYWAILLLVVGVGEVMTTYNAFLNFEEPSGTTIIIALCTAFGLGLAAHFSGVFFSRSRSHKHNLIYAIGTMVFACGLIVVLANVRAQALHEEVAIRALGQSTFFFTSMVLYLIGAILSFTTHDSDKAFEDLLIDRQELQKQIDEKEVHLHAQRVIAQEHLRSTQLAINRKHQEEMQKISSYVDRAEVTLVEAKALAEQMWTGIRNLEDFIIQSMKTIIHTYRDANMRARKEDYPTAWDQQIPEPPRNFRPSNVGIAATTITDDNNNKPKPPGLWHYNPN